MSIDTTPKSAYVATAPGLLFNSPYGSDLNILEGKGFVWHVYFPKMDPLMCVHAHLTRNGGAPSTRGGCLLLLLSLDGTL